MVELSKPAPRRPAAPAAGPHSSPADGIASQQHDEAQPRNRNGRVRDATQTAKAPSTSVKKPPPAFTTMAKSPILPAGTPAFEELGQQTRGPGLAAPGSVARSAALGASSKPHQGSGAVVYKSAKRAPNLAVEGLLKRQLPRVSPWVDGLGSSVDKGSASSGLSDAEKRSLIAEQSVWADEMLRRSVRSASYLIDSRARPD